MTTVHNRYHVILVCGDFTDMQDTAMKKTEAFEVGRNWLNKDQSVDAVVVFDSMARKGAANEWRLTR